MNVDIKDHRGRPIRCRPKTKMAKGSTLWVPDGYWEQSEQEKPIALIAKEMDRPIARAMKIVEADDFIHECAQNISALATRQARLHRDGSNSRARRAAQLYQDAKRQMHARLVKELPSTRAGEVPTPKNYKAA